MPANASPRRVPTEYESPSALLPRSRRNSTGARRVPQLPDLDLRDTDQIKTAVR